MKSKRSVQGFALASALFLFVILAALGAFIASISTQQQVGLALDIEGERAYQAANAAMDWARFRLSASGTPPTCPPATTWGASTKSIDFAGTTTLLPYFATVECQLVQASDVGGVGTWVFEVRVTACNRPMAAEPRCPGNTGQLGYVERQLQGLLGF